MRTLAFNEIHLVAGGMQEVVVSEKRPSSGDPVDPFGTGFNPQDIYGEGEGGNEPEKGDETLLYGACVTAAMLAGHHLGEKHGKWLMAQLMMRVGAVVGSVAGPGGAVVGGVAGYHAGAQWGEKHGAVYGGAAGTLIGTQACPKD